MLAFGLRALVVTALAIASPHLGARPAEAEALRPSDLMSALRASDVAEIYVISRSINFPTIPRPETVREVGCKYLVHRESPQWRDLERSLADADIRFATTTRRGEVRVGLVLSDWRGTVREIYSEDLPWPNGRTNGFDQRRLVEISASFVAALRGFVARHPDLALPDAGPTPRCPARRR